MPEQKKFWESIKDYDKEVFSVFADKKAKNPLVPYLNKKSSRKTIGEFGCGIGHLIPFLEKKFNKVYAVDYAENMLKKAKEKSNGKTTFIHSDMRKLGMLKGKLDVAVSVNSILPAQITDVNVILRQIHSTLKKNGEFVGILASADNVAHFALLEYERLLEKGLSSKDVEKHIEKLFKSRNKTSFLGFHRDSPKDPRQKYYYPFEIKWRFAKAGFSDVKLQKVYYSWEYTRNHHYGYFPGSEQIWDWFVVAKR